MDELVELLHEIEQEQQGLRGKHAHLMRTIVHKAGGVNQAAELLGLDPKTVRARERAAGLSLILYRGSNTAKVDLDGRVYGETGQGEDSDAQREADRKWFNLSRTNEELLHLVVYVADGTVVRAREVEGEWEWNEDGKAALPVGPPLTSAELAQKYPTFPFTIGDELPMIRGKIREYVTL
ncbi:hypothetical protein [Streptacidiphilus albus]|uniref:hypothetical protein n=1 Tax=Streptacidiphilus albus TaxID=105425 RepID=UPI000A87F1B5|nr:hypothetical protein [Streptacidiphilus albus]